MKLLIKYMKYEIIDKIHEINKYEIIKYMKL